MAATSPCRDIYWRLAERIVSRDGGRYNVYAGGISDDSAIFFETRVEFVGLCKRLELTELVSSI